MDIALAVEKLYGVADYGTATTYKDLQRTWRDSRPIPTMSQLETAWAEIQKEQMQKQFTAFVQSLLDSEALKRNYDNIVSATSYAGYVNQFQAEGIAFGVWRSAVWAKCYEIMADVLDGKRQVPTEEQLLSELPKLTL